MCSSDLTEQMALLPDDGAELLLPVEEQRRRYTGERVARNRERYEGIVNAIACGMSRRDVAAAFRCSTNTVHKIEAVEPRLVETRKARLAGQFAAVSLDTLEAFAQDLRDGKVPPSVKWVASAAFMDKSILLSGGATSRHEVVSGDRQASVAEAFAALRSANAVAEAVPSTDSQSGGDGGDSR